MIVNLCQTQSIFRDPSVSNICIYVYILKKADFRGQAPMYSLSRDIELCVINMISPLAQKVFPKHSLLIASGP